MVRDTSGANMVQSIPAAIDVELTKELDHFEKVLEQKLSVVVLSSSSGYIAMEHEAPERNS